MQFIGSKVTIYYIVGRPLIHDVLFYFLSEVFGYQLGCTVAAVSFQQPVEHVKNTVLYKSSRMILTVEKKFVGKIGDIT